MAIHSASDHIKVAASVPPLLRDNTSVNGAAVDTSGYDKALVVIHIGANDIASTFELEDSADNSSFADVDLPSTGVSIVTSDADETNEIRLIEVDLTANNVRRYLRVQHTAGNGTVGTNASACILLMNGRTKNPSQENTVVSF